MNGVGESLALLEMAHIAERYKQERDDWRECVERLVWSAPLAFSSDVNWMKALVYAKKLTQKNLATQQVDHLLENNNL